MNSHKIIKRLISAFALGVYFVSLNYADSEVDPSSVSSAAQASQAQQNSAADSIPFVLADQPSNDSSNANSVLPSLLGADLSQILPSTTPKYLLTPEGKAVLVDGRPVYNELLEDGRPRFTVATDDETGRVFGYCDELSICYPVGSPALSYQNPDEIPLVIKSYNQHIYDTEGKGQTAYPEKDSETTPQQSNESETLNNSSQVQVPDPTQNDPGTITPVERKECANAASNGAALPNLSSGCIDSANKQLSPENQIPGHCASDFAGPLLPAQSSQCAKNPHVKKSADSFLFAEAASTDKSKESKDKDDEEDGTKNPHLDEDSIEPKKSVEEVADAADEALDEVENNKDSIGVDNEQSDESNDTPESESRDADEVDESRGAGIESIAESSVEGSDTKDEPKKEVSDPNEMPEWLRLDPKDSDEDDTTDDSVSNDEVKPLAGSGFWDRNKDFEEDDDLESEPGTSDEFKEMEDLLGLDSSEAEKPDKVEKVKEEDLSEKKQQLGKVDRNEPNSESQQESDDSKVDDVDALKEELNAADGDIDFEKENLTYYDEKTGVKILRKNKEGFIAKTVKDKSKSDKKVSGLDEKYLMERFSLTKDELRERVEVCRRPGVETHLITKDIERCLENDVSLFGDSLIMQTD